MKSLLVKLTHRDHHTIALHVLVRRALLRHELHITVEEEANRDPKACVRTVHQFLHRAERQLLAPGTEPQRLRVDDVEEGGTVFRVAIVQNCRGSCRADADVRVTACGERRCVVLWSGAA